MHITQKLSIGESMALNYLVHREILIAILADIFKDETLGPLVGFKGGTAAMLFYGLDRFSVDLDFDLLAEDEDFVCEKIRHILELYGTIRHERKSLCLFFLLAYTGKKLKDQNIKVEVSRKRFGSQYEMKLYMGIAMNVMIQEDMAAHELVAMYERFNKTARDIYDVWFFFKHQWPVNKKIVEKRTGMSYKSFLKACIEHLEKMDDRFMLFGLGELLTPQQKSWARQNLRKETIFLLQLAYKTEEEQVQ